MTGTGGPAGSPPALAPRSRPAYLHWPNLGLVLVGGILGVAAREGASLVITEGGDMPVVVPVVNLLSAFLLGYLYTALARMEPGEPTTSRLKLTVGTGFCGGLSTYSSLATDTAVLILDAHGGLALVYSLGTVIVGAGATILGIVAGDRLHARGQATS